MTIQPIGTASVALYITPADLREHGLTPAQLTLERALELTQTAFDEAGITLDGAIEIEAYPNACGVLVFARIRVPEHLWLSFGDCEDLIAAAQAMPVACPEAALLWYDGRWWLSLPAGQERLAGLLSEFGRSERPCPYLDACLTEHGHPILERDALAALLQHFPAARPSVPALPPV
jgi:negative regulator of genetic competence, sporulation and motility